MSGTPETVIEVDNLGKKYLLSHQRPERYTALRDVIARRARALGRRLLAPFRRQNREPDPTREEFWALQDVSFRVNRGDVLGVIGRNGAGKSTLLKILSRITEPTTGRIALSGRVASLLEVGTGFHPELTGRENIYLNGAILGMTRSEIKRKFDAIVAFAEVERFLDTPVKRYSSGMYVRLAFAVAAHLEPEILIIDEVLAVGDAAFQKKCLGKMGEVGKSGKTVLFVSHNFSAVASLCTRGIVLEKGRVLVDTGAGDAIACYTRRINEGELELRGAGEAPRIRKIVLDQDALRAGDLRVRVGFTSPFKLDPPVVGVVVSTLHGMPLFGSNPQLHRDGFEPQALASGEAILTVPRLPLHSGPYKLAVYLGDRHNHVYDSQLDALLFDFVSSRPLPGNLSTEVIGVFDVTGRWELKPGGGE